MPRRARHSAEGPHDNEERWLLTYADMITLLFVLFVVMYAISNTDVRKFVALAQSMQAAFNADVIPGQAPITVMSGGESIPMDKDYDTSTGVINTDMRTVKAALRDFAIDAGLGAEVDVAKTEDGIVIHLSDALLFSPGRAHLDERARGIVNEVAKIVGPLPNPIRVEGNTDDVAPTGGLYEDNWQLSTARALSVLDALRDQGIGPARLSAAGYAEFNPMAPNTDDASRAKNRRVDILILYPHESASPAPSATPTVR